MTGSGLALRAVRATAIFAAVFAASVCSAQGIVVKVDKSGQRVVLDVEVLVDGSVSQAWSVFTDYEAMPSFLKNVTHSKVLTRRGDSLTVEQSGAATVAFMQFAFHAVRSVELVPLQEIRSVMVSGSFKEYASTTRFAPTDRGVLITHHGEYVPKSWLPPVIGPAIIESETRKQYQQFVAEIARRAAQKVR
ncbi:MAG: SRPBCC family protein [Caldimonas sp.]